MVKGERVKTKLIKRRERSKKRKTSRNENFGEKQIFSNELLNLKNKILPFVNN